MGVMDQSENAAEACGGDADKLKFVYFVYSHRRTDGKHRHRVLLP